MDLHGVAIAGFEITAPAVLKLAWPTPRLSGADGVDGIVSQQLPSAKSHSSFGKASGLSSYGLAFWVTRGGGGGSITCRINPFLYCATTLALGPAVGASFVSSLLSGASRL